MPQITYEVTNNIKDLIDLAEYAQKVHEVLVEILPTKLADCKSRLYTIDNYYIGDGNSKSAFFHAKVEIMPGRSLETKDKAGKAIASILSSLLSQVKTDHQIQITVEISELGVYNKQTGL